MENLAENLTRLIQLNNSNLCDLELKKIKFGLECFFGEISKFIIYLFIFWLFSLTKYFLVATLFFCIPRTMAGGYHEETFWRCFFTSLMIFTGILGVSLNMTFSISIKLMLVLITMILFFIYSPVDHPNKPIISEQRRKRLKYASFVMVMALIIISFFLPEKYSTIAVIALLFEAISLPFGALSKKVWYKWKLICWSRLQISNKISKLYNIIYMRDNLY